MDTKTKIEPTLESTNYLLLNLIKLCDRYYNQIEKKLRQLTEYRNESNLNLQMENGNELKELEQQFWNDLKTFKESNESIVLQYIIGVYTKLQQITLLYFNLNKKNDTYFIHGICTKNCEIEFLYNVYIHLGDLSRYQKSIKIAKQFYLKARSLNPLNGQSYNQLALIYGSDPIKSIYFYVRAYLAVESSKIAFNNIKLSVKHFQNTNQLIKLIFDSSSTATKPDKIKVDNWLYLIVIAMFADNMNSIVNYLFDDLNYWFKFKSISINSSLHQEKDETDTKYLFAGFDLFLDYCLNCLSNQESNQRTDSSTATNQMGSSTKNLFTIKFNLNDYDKRLKDFKEIIESYSTKVNLNSTIDPIVLRHDFLLHGLNLLQKQHSILIFTDKNSKYAKNLNLLICRIRLKLAQLIAQIDKKTKQTKQTQKKMRNVALQSILDGNG